MQTLITSVLNADLTGPLASLRPSESPVDFRQHLLYNPDRNTQFNIVPGLIGVILTMTMVFITALAITREKERGTMENLLSTPVRPAEVMLGKIIPFILVGYIQVVLILLGARFLFQVPIEGSLTLLVALGLLFIVANLAVGVTISSVAKNQLQAVQMSIFFFLPSMLLSGFMFPFRGMPGWAQVIGNILPLTHFLPIVRASCSKATAFPPSPNTSGRFSPSRPSPFSSASKNSARPWTDKKSPVYMYPGSSKKITRRGRIHSSGDF
jgi:ABC-2 type transport system permease protein